MALRDPTGFWLSVMRGGASRRARAIDGESSAGHDGIGDPDDHWLRIFCTAAVVIGW